MFSWLVQARDNTWQLRQKQSEKGKQRPQGRELDKGTFTKNPSEIAKDLKQHSTDYGQAVRRLTNFTNRKAPYKRRPEENQRLDQAKDALKNAYGVRDKPKSTEPAKPAKPAKPAQPAPPASPATNASTRLKADPVLMNPSMDHNGDVQVLDTGLGELQAASRLRRHTRM